MSHVNGPAMHTSSVVLVLTLFLSSLVAGQVDQKESLLLLRAAIDRQGTLDWSPSTDVCTWEGITCNGANQVITIDLQSKGLQGQLPLDESLWSNLNTLQNINLAQNEISGFVPPQISNVDALEYLSFSGNQLESILPVSWDVLANLKGVDLSGNNLFGDLPEEWSKLTNLEAIDLSGNNFTGQIPASWATLPNLAAASFAGNVELCKDNPNAGDSSIPVFYGPCEPSSPQLPNVNPTYPPVPSPEPAPEPSPVPSPSPEPAPEPSPSPAPVPSPAPISKPSNYIKMKFKAVGLTQEEFNKEINAYTLVMANAAKVPPGWIDVTTTVVENPSRRLLLQATTLEITNTIYTDNSDETIDTLSTAVDDGSLAQALDSLGLILVPESVEFEEESSTNVGAIVGGTIGGVVGVAILGWLGWFLYKRKRDAPLKAGKVGKVVQGEKSGTAMYTTNPLADEDDDAKETGQVKASTKEEFKTYEGAAYDADSTPPVSGRGTSAAAKGVNPLSLERTGSDLSDPGDQTYATPSDTTGPLTARSKLDSARSGLQSEKMYDVPAEIASSDDEGNNPMFESPRTGTTGYDSVQTGLELDSSRRYDTATESAKTSARTGTSMKSNAMFNADQDEEGTNNPFFDSKGK